MKKMLNDFKGAALPIQERDYIWVAGYLGCEIAALKAIITVESNGKAFMWDGRPTILNEPHWFYRLLKGSKKTTAIRQGLAYKNWKTKPYPRTQKLRYDWLMAAAEIDTDAALQSCSWGLGQVMGFNYKVCGFASPTDFAKAMMHSEGAQVLAIARFIVGNNLQRHVRNKDWASFARGYNGPSFAKNNYHTKMANAYKRRPVSEKTIPPVPTDAMLDQLLGKNKFVPANKPVTKPVQLELNLDDNKSKPKQPSIIDTIINLLKGLFK